MVQVGEKYLHDLHGHPTLGLEDGAGDVNTLTPGAVNRHSKSREGYPAHWADVGSKLKGRLAWRHSAMPKRYLYPASFARAMVRMRDAGIVPNADLDAYQSKAPLPRMYAPGFEDSLAYPPHDISGDAAGDLGHGKAFDGKPAKPTRGRLPKEYVKWIEDQLDLSLIHI